MKGAERRQSRLSDAANIWVQLGHRLKENGRAEEAEKAHLEAGP